MATTAHAVSNLDVTIPDDIMDLHSDSGLDFDDGDIELDIDLPPPQAQDDDVSIKDAVTDPELDPNQPTMADPDYSTADADDVMADHEDYGADNMQYGINAYQDTNFSNHTTLVQEQVPAPTDDDDLIDYSDEEEDDEPPSEHTPANMYPPVSNSGGDAGIRGDAVKDQEDNVYETHDEERHLEEDDVHGTNDAEQEKEEEAVYETYHQDHQHEDEFPADDEADNHTDGEDGGVLLEELEAQTNLSEHQPDSPEEQRSVETRLITVNYEGNELWLFKQHDTENSGDWLVDDISLIHSSLSDLFRAFRASLGEDLSNETELGLRFDHFHNMELFEDSTACVAVSLERLVDLYHTLHAQDGESEPESFYMCLLSRPRFATLLSDVARHAEQGSGYSGLNAAVAAGETHFADMYSGHSTEHEGAEWDHEDGVDAEGDETQQNERTESASEAEPEAEYVEHDNPHATDVESDDNVNTKDTAEEEHDDVSAIQTATQVDQDAHDDKVPTPQNNAEDGEEFAQLEIPDQAAQQAVQTLASEQEEQLAHDTVDYSDQEDEDETHGGNPDAASLSSATVQGDNSVIGESSFQVAEPVNLVQEEEDYHHDDDDDATNNTFDQGHDGDAQAEEHLDHDNTESYQDYDRVYDQEDPFKEFHVDAPDACTTEPDYNGLTNQDDTSTYEYQDLEEQLQYDFTNAADFDDTGAGESTNVENDIAHVDDILGLDNAPDWPLDEEPISAAPEDTIVLHDEVYEQNKEEEDGVFEQPVVTASSAADPVAASSADLHQDSPQGTKRSIDEVGDSVGDALDHTDMKRPRV